MDTGCERDTYFFSMLKLINGIDAVILLSAHLCFVRGNLQFDINFLNDLNYLMIVQSVWLVLKQFAYLTETSSRVMLNFIKRLLTSSSPNLNSCSGLYLFEAINREMMNYKSK